MSERASSRTDDGRTDAAKVERERERCRRRRLVKMSCAAAAAARDAAAPEGLTRCNCEASFAAGAELLRTPYPLFHTHPARHPPGLTRVPARSFRHVAGLTPSGPGNEIPPPPVPEFFLLSPCLPDPRARLVDHHHSIIPHFPPFHTIDKDNCRNLPP